MGRRPPGRLPRPRAVPGQLPRALPRRGPGRLRRRPRREALLPPAGRRARTWTWTSCSGAATTGSSPARAPSTWPRFLGRVLAAGYTGPLSLEVFNDVFRQADPGRAAVDAMRSLLWLEERLTRRPSARQPAAARPGADRATRSPSSPSTASPGPQVADALAALGFAHTGQHRSKPVQLWEQGDGAGAAQRLGRAPGRRRGRRGGRDRAGEHRPRRGRRPGPRRAARRSCPAPAGPRRPTCRPSPRPTAPRCSSPAPARRLAGRLPADRRREPGAGRRASPASTTSALTQPFDSFDEAALFYRAVLGLEPETVTEYAAPFGLVRSRAVTGPDRRGAAGAQRRACCAAAAGRPACPTRSTSPSPPTTSSRPREPLRAAGAPLLRRAGQLPRRPRGPARPRRRGCWPRCASAGCCTTRTRTAATCTWPPRCSARGCSSRSCSGSDGYDGYGTADAPVRMAAHRRLRTSAE